MKGPSGVVKGPSGTVKGPSAETESREGFDDDEEELMVGRKGIVEMKVTKMMKVVMRRLMMKRRPSHGPLKPHGKTTHVERRDRQTSTSVSLSFP